MLSRSHGRGLADMMLPRSSGPSLSLLVAIVFAAAAVAYGGAPVTIESPAPIGFSFPGYPLVITYKTAVSVPIGTVRWTAYRLNNTVLNSTDWIADIATIIANIGSIGSLPTVVSQTDLGSSPISSSSTNFTWNVAEDAVPAAYLVTAGIRVPMNVIPVVIGLAPTFLTVNPVQVPLFSGNLPRPDLLSNITVAAPGSTISTSWTKFANTATTTVSVAVLPVKYYPQAAAIKFFVTGQPDIALILAIPGASVVTISTPVDAPLAYTVPADAEEGDWVFSIASTTAFNEYGFTYYQVGKGGGGGGGGGEITPAPNAGWTVDLVGNKTVTIGSEITCEWSGSEPVRDLLFVGVFHQDAPANLWLGLKSVLRNSGSWKYTFTALDLAIGGNTYVCALTTTNMAQWSYVAVSSKSVSSNGSFIPASGYSIDFVPANDLVAGDSVSSTWNTPIGVRAGDLVALYRTDVPSFQPLLFEILTPLSNQQTTGTWSFELPATLDPGSYETRYVHRVVGTGIFVPLARSPERMVTSPTTYTISPSVTSAKWGDSVTLSYTASPAAGPQTWAALRLDGTQYAFVPDSLTTFPEGETMGSTTFTVANGIPPGTYEAVIIVRPPNGIVWTAATANETVSITVQ